VLSRDEVLWLAKDGNRPEEYEDAAIARWVEEVDGPAYYCAVADGATESVYADLWATMLVEAYSRGELSNSGLRAALAAVRQEWHRLVEGRPRPWYMQHKLRSGSFASLTGLILRDAGAMRARGGVWTAMAVGDSCLFQIRGDRLITCFPITSPAQFNNRPTLLGSSPGENPDLEDLQISMSGSWQPHDEFLLMTDALALWFLKAHERGEQPWLELRSLWLGEPERAFEAWAEERRMCGELRNDDLTLLRVAM